MTEGSWKRIGADPDELVVSIDEARNACRETSTRQNDLFRTLIDAATRYVEEQASLSFFDRQWEWIQDELAPELVLPVRPFQSLDALEWRDSGGVYQDVDSSLYAVDSHADPAVIYRREGKSWPDRPEKRPDAYRVQFTAGYGTVASSIPATLREAILQLVCHWYDHPEAVVEPTGSAPVPTPLGFWSLLEAEGRTPGF